MKILHLGIFFYFSTGIKLWALTKYQVITCFDPNCFNEILSAEKVNIKSVSEAVNEVDSVALKQELMG